MIPRTNSKPFYLCNNVILKGYKRLFMIDLEQFVINFVPASIRCFYLKMENQKSRVDERKTQGE